MKGSRRDPRPTERTFLLSVHYLSRFFLEMLGVPSQDASCVMYIICRGGGRGVTLQRRTPAAGCSADVEIIHLR